MKLFLIITLYAAAIQAVPWEPEAKTDAWWVEMHESFKETTARNPQDISIIFYGDSITDFWREEGKELFESLYAPLGAVNYGIEADKIENLLYRINDGEIDQVDPKLVVLLIGTNNDHDNPDDVVEGIKATVDLLLRQLPNSKILLLGLLPRNDADYFTRLLDINIKISKLHDGYRVYFLDMFHQYASAWGVVNKDLYLDDELHLSTAGYKVWADTMEPLFNYLRFINAKAV